MAYCAHRKIQKEEDRYRQTQNRETGNVGWMLDGSMWPAEGGWTHTI